MMAAAGIAVHQASNNKNNSTPHAAPPLRLCRHPRLPVQQLVTQAGTLEHGLVELNPHVFQVNAGRCALKIGCVVARAGIDGCNRLFLLLSTDHSPLSLHTACINIILCSMIVCRTHQQRCSWQ